MVRDGEGWQLRCSEVHEVHTHTHTHRHTDTQTHGHTETQTGARIKQRDEG